MEGGCVFVRRGAGEQVRVEVEKMEVKIGVRVKSERTETERLLNTTRDIPGQNTQPDRKEEAKTVRDEEAVKFGPPGIHHGDRKDSCGDQEQDDPKRH